MIRQIAYLVIVQAREVPVKYIIELHVIIPLDQFEVSIVPEVPPQLLVTHWDRAEAQKWLLKGFAIENDYVGAVTWRGPSKEVKYFKWQHLYSQSLR